MCAVGKCGLWRARRTPGAGNEMSHNKKKRWRENTYACKFEDFSSQVLEDGCDVDGSLCAYAHLVLGVVLEETLDTTARELMEVTLVRSSKTVGIAGAAGAGNNNNNNSPNRES